MTSPAVIREEYRLDEFAAVLEEIFSRQPGAMVAPNRVIASGASATSTMASSDPTDPGHSPDRITARPRPDDGGGLDRPRSHRAHAADRSETRAPTRRKS